MRIRSAGPCRSCWAARRLTALRFTAQAYLWFPFSSDVCAGLITGCIGAGGGFIIAPALMSAGVKGILAVGTDLFHIFAKAIMGSVIHRKLGNVSAALAVVFLIGAIIGATVGGVINRVLYEINPVLSDAFITTVYSLMLGFLGTYAMTDFLKAKKAERKDFHGKESPWQKSRRRRNGEPSQKAPGR